MFNRRVLDVKPSATAELIGKVADYKRRGIDVMQFNVGEPDFDTPAHICDEARLALDNGFTRYTAVAGIHELREAIANKLKKENGIDCAAENVAVTVGGKQAVYNSIIALCNEGDEVIVLTPCWVSYIEMVTLAGAIPVLVETKEEEDFLLNIDNLKKAVTAKTKAIIINTPNNPTGAVYTKKSLEELAVLAVANNIYVISDEIYEKLLYENGQHHSIASFNEDINKLTLTINGFAKAFAMTGWRIGYVAGDKDLMKQLIKIQGHSTSATNSIAQKAAVAALEGTQEPVAHMVSEYANRRVFLYSRLNAMENISCAKATGAFYLVPNISKFFGKSYNDYSINDSFDMADYLLEEAKVAVVPGKAFEMPNNIRIAYSNSLDNIKEGMNRMEEALSKLK
jgi:aspartate aminotransferase